MSTLAKSCSALVLLSLCLDVRLRAEAQDVNPFDTPPPVVQRGKGDSDSKSSDAAKPAAGAKGTENKVEFEGTVIDDQQGKPVAGATIIGLCNNPGGFLEAIPGGRLTAGDDGRFKLERGLTPVILQAMTPDSRQIGIVRIAGDTKEVTIRVGPVAQATGLVVDDAGNPVTQGYINYGIRVSANKDGALRLFPYGVALLDGEGRYTLTGLAPGNTYEPMYVPKVSTRGMPNVAAARPTTDGMLDVGTTKIPKNFAITAPVAPTGDNLERARIRQRKVSELTLKSFTGIGCDFVVQRAVGSNPLDNNLPEEFDNMADMVPGIKWGDGTSYVLVDFVDFKTEGLTDVPVIGWRTSASMFNRLKIAEGGETLYRWQQRAALLGAAIAKKLNKKLGDPIELYGDKFQVVGIYESPVAEENDCLIISIRELQNLANQKGEVSGFGITAERPLDNEGLEQLRHHIAAIQPRLKVTRVPRAIGNDAGK